MRSRVFEEALIEAKLQKAIFGENNKTNYMNRLEAPYGTTGKELSKESIKVIVDLLKLCIRPQTKAKILHKLNPELVNSYIHYLLAQGLLNEEGNKMRTTKKGRDLIELLSKLQGFFGVDPLE